MDIISHIEQTYRVECELGSGGSGAVYKAWHLRLQKYVVIKEVMHGAIDNINARRNEVEALKNVKSAYLPHVFDYLTDGDSAFTVMEFIEGESFDKLLGQGRRFAGSQVVKWYGQLASALEAIHSQSICHRDIKPSNIMLTPGGDICLIDFNAALVKENASKLISRSLGYASPEQYDICAHLESVCDEREKLNGTNGADGQDTDAETELLEGDSMTEFTSGADEAIHFQQTTYTQLKPRQDDIDWKRSDIYNLGATMYHILTGKRPPKRADEIVTLPKNRRYSVGIAYIIKRSMRLDPMERFASASAITQALRSVSGLERRKKLVTERPSQIKKTAAVVTVVIAAALVQSIRERLRRR